MPDLAERLDALATMGEPRGADAVFRAARAAATADPTRVGGRGRARLLVGIAAALVAVAVVVAAVTIRDDEPTSVRVGTGGGDATGTPSGDPAEILRLFDTMDEPATGPQPLYLVPTEVPEGYDLIRAQGGRDGSGLPQSSGGSPSVERSQTWIRVLAGAPDPRLDSFELSWTAPGSDAAALTTPRDGGEVVTVNGDLGVLSEGLLSWPTPAGRIATLVGRTTSRDELVQIATSVAEDERGLAIGSPPAGYELAFEAPGMASTGRDVRELVYGDSSGNGFRVVIASQTERPPGSVLLVDAPLIGGVPSTQRVDVVRDRPAMVNAPLVGGAIYDNQTMFLRQPGSTVQWLEPQNTIVVVSSVGMSEDETLAVARSLRQVDQAEWDTMVAQAPGRGGAPSAPVAGDAVPPFTGDDAAIEEVFLAWLSAGSDDDVAAVLEDGDSLRPSIAAAEALRPAPRDQYSGAVESIRRVGEDRALVTYTVVLRGQSTMANLQGSAVRVDGRWLVTRATYCSIVSVGGVICSPQ